MILVTGGSGFIGSHVVDKLIDEGHGVRVFDIVKPHREDVNFFRGDMLNLDDLKKAMNGIDYVYHLAAVSNVNVAHKDPITCVRINSEGTAKVLEAARKASVKRCILASTTWVYDGFDKLNVDEETPLYAPKHIYTSTKIAQEHIFQNYYHMYGLPYTILRYGIPYGPRSRKGTVMPIFVEKALKGEPLTIFGKGDQFRTFLYVEDLAKGNVAALKDIAENKIYNLAGNERISILQIAETIKKILKNDVKTEFLPERKGDFPGKLVSIEKSRIELGWEPKVPFEGGLRRYIEWYKSIG